MVRKPELFYKLTEEKKKVAEENYGLIFFFMGKRKVPAWVDQDDYFSYLTRWYLRSIATYNPGKASLSTYVLKMLGWSRCHYLRRQSENYKKRCVSIHQEDGGDAIHFPVYDDQDRNLKSKEVKVCLEKLLDAVGPTRRRIFDMHLQGVPLADIARILGVSRQRIDQVIDRSIRVMRAHAEANGIRNPVGAA